MKMPIKEMITLAEIMKKLSVHDTKGGYNILLNVVCNFVMKTAKSGRKEEALKDFQSSLEESLEFYMDKKTHENMSIKLAQILEKAEMLVEEEEKERKSMPDLDFRFN